VLALLVAVSLILLTAYFGESTNSPLHSVQRGIVAVLSPVQQGASTVLSPVRDVAHWFSDTFSAKAERDKLRKQNQQLIKQNASLQAAATQNAQLTKQVGLDNQLSVSSYRPVTGQVISQDPSLWYQTIQVDKGSGDGVSQYDPVTGDGALVGLVTTVGPNYSIVTEITDHSYAVAARALDTLGDRGVLKPSIGNPNQLLLTDLPSHANISTGELVVTAGFKSGPLQSLYPPGIPIGTVSDVNPQADLLNNQQVQVSPAADLRHLDVVQILTGPNAGTQRAQVSTGTG
jgi:rod shape-determining protein MreC